MRVFNIDITRKGISPVVQVTEYDAMSRFFTLVLRNGSSDYEPPENPNYSVWYKTKDSTGWYDTITLPDESTRPAVVADGNAFTIEIAEQATTSCGELALMINGDDGYQLTVSGIITRSADIPGYDGEEVENYYNVFITRMQENAARAENAADIAVAYGATVEVDEDAQQLNITHHSDTEGGVCWLFGSAVASSAEGSVAAFPDGANDVAVKSLVAEITPVQSGTGDPSPTNVRAISGRTGLTVTAAGKNLFDGVFTNQNSNQIQSGEFVLPAGTYTYSQKYNGTPTWGVYIQKPNGTSLAYIYSTNKLTFTLTSPELVVIRIYYGQGITPSEVTEAQLEVGSTATPYEPYRGASYPVSWQTEAGTVYGGTLDVVSGVLTVDKAMATFDGSNDEDWAYYSVTTGNLFRTPLAERVEQIIPNFPENYACNSYHVAANASSGRTNGTFSGNVKNVDFVDDRYSTVEDWRAALAQTPIQFVYPLATPSTYQLTPTAVKTLLGGNTIYTDAGAVSVEYVADTKLYIDNKVAELQALILEN